jgi:eukaryotic-like serine/threonine-protein kinase
VTERGALTPERWRRVSAVFQQALDRATGARAQFLDQACAGDTALRGEVESLLAAHSAGGATGFLERPAPEAALGPGARLGPYEISGLLGAGGMGEVYRARDTRLGRDVAVKVLAAGHGAHEDRRRRFEREARAAAMLSHPNVLAVYDVGTEQGIDYVVSELLEGETLRARLDREPPGWRQALEWAAQAAAGLAAAHAKRIVHRDLKPENLFLTAEGRVKVLDFGLAKLRPSVSDGDTATAATAPGVLLGTLAYMSPEQARAGEADERSDVFAFGAVLYELLCGRRAFDRPSPPETLAAVLFADPDFAALPPEVPAPLARLLRRCLQKSPEHRYASGAALEQALAGAAGAAGPDQPAPHAWTVAVLPFREIGGDPDLARLGLGLADAAITELAAVRSLVVRPTSAVLRYGDAAVDPRRAAGELGVDAVLEGRVQRAGAQVRVTMQLVDGADGRTLWASKVDAALTDLFSVQDEVARRITEALDVELTPSDERRLGRRGRERAARGEAYALYLKGRAQLFRETLGDCIRAIDWFEQARAADPGFALAWAGLADAYIHVAFEFEPEGDWYARADEMCARALALDPELPEARYVRARLLWSPHGGFDHAGGLRELAAAAAGRPGLDVAYVRAGVQLFHVGLIDEAERQLRRALAISPAHIIAQGHLGSCRFHQGRFAEALEMLLAMADPRRSYWQHYLIAHCRLRLGELDAAAEVALRMQDLGDEGIGHGHAIRGLVAARRGDADAAREGARRALAVKKAFGHFHHDQYDVACIHALCGDTDEALRWLAAAAGNGYPCRPFFEADPILAVLHGDARFVELMERIGAECAGYARLWEELRTSATA